MYQQRKMARQVRLLVVAVSIVGSVLAASATAWGHSWNFESCQFAGTNWMAGSNGNSSTTELNPDECDNLWTRLQFRTDGYWFWSSAAYSYGNLGQVVRTVQLVQTIGDSQHRAQDNSSKNYSSTYTHP